MKKCKHNLEISDCSDCYKLEKWVKEFDEKFNYAHFTWNGDNALGIKLAKKQKAKVRIFISNLLQEERKKVTSDIDKFICEWLKNHANTPLEKRKDPFHEVVDLRRDLIKLIK